MNEQLFESRAEHDTFSKPIVLSDTPNQLQEQSLQEFRFGLADRNKSAVGLPEITFASDKDDFGMLAAAKKPPGSETHTMSSRVFSWGWTFDIKDENGKPEGVVDQKLLNWTKTFEYSDASGAKLATGRERALSWGVKIDVTDDKGKPIGGIQEQVFKSWWHPHTIYSIVDDKGVEIAKSEKVEFGATDFTLTNTKGEKIATIHRPWLNWVRDNWTIDILKPNEVDKRLLYMIPAYKTSADAERREREAEEEAEEAERNKKDNDD